MMKYFFLLFPIFFYAQLNYERDWATYHYASTSGKFVAGAFVDGEENLYYAITGNYSDEGTNESSRLFKFASAGNLLWAFEFDIQPEYSIIIDDLKMDNEGNIVFCGYTNSPNNIATEDAWQVTNAGENDRLLGKINPNGDLIWCTYFGGTANDIQTQYSIYASNIQITPENEIIWQSPFLSEGLGTLGTFQPEHQNANHMISKFNTDGQRVWTTYYGVDESYSIQSNMVLGETDIFVAGVSTNETYFDTFGNTWPEEVYSDYFISSFDFNGNRNWSRYLGSNGYLFEQRQNLAMVEKDLFFTGWSNSPNFGTFNSYNPSIPQDHATSFLASFSETGYLNWSTYLGENAEDSNLNNIVELPSLSSHDDKVFVSGGTLKRDLIATSSAFQENNMGETDAFTMIFSPNGDLQWGTFYGGFGYEEFIITAPFDGGFYLLGSTNSTSNISTPGAYQEEFSGNVQDIFIVKFVEENLGVTDQDTADALFSIYPNPAKEVVQVKINEMQAEKVHVRLFSMNGKLIKTKIVSSSSTEIDVRGLVPGSYVIVVENGNKISSQKLLIE